MNIVPELEKLGFKCGLYWTWDGERYHIDVDEAGEFPPPLVYVIVDAKGASIRVGRSLKQIIRKREGSTAKGMNRESTEGQNNKSVIKGLRVEVRENGPLRSYVKSIETEDAARQAELGLFDLFRGRLDMRRG